MADELKQLSPPDFPPLLREIPDAPKQLQIRGTLPSYEWKWLAVVGSRACTPYGKQVVSYFIQALRGQPVVVVSGLAFGIDAEAHRAALDAGLPTVAVPGSGLDWKVLYPKANASLAREILAAGGAHLSEFEPMQMAADYTFPKRNRVMVGLSHATLVVEAKEQSGSLITARLAAEYNRELLVVPGSIFADTSRGTHQFLKLGATPVTDPEDILKALGLSAREPRTFLRADLSDDEMKVLERLATPRTRDELLAMLGLPVAEAQVLLSMMEIKGLITEEFGALRQA